MDLATLRERQGWKLEQKIDHAVPTRQAISSVQGEAKPEGACPNDFLAQNQVESSQKEKATLGAENQRTQIK